MLDSRMTEEELYLEQEDQSTAEKQGKKNIRANNQIFPNSLLNNSYDDIKQRDRAKTKKKAMATHRKELGQSVNITKNSSRNSRTHRKQRSISMRSTRNKPSILRASRNISDTLSEKSFSQRGGDRSLSMSLRHEKNVLKDTMRKIKFETKEKDTHEKLEELKSKLAKERKKNYEMKKSMEAMQKKLDKTEKYVKKVKSIKKDYNDLLDHYEKSEKIRISQKELINALRAENAKLRKDKPVGAAETEEKPKPKVFKKKTSKETNKSTTRQKSKRSKKVPK